MKKTKVKLISPTFGRKLIAKDKDLVLKKAKELIRRLCEKKR